MHRNPLILTIAGAVLFAGCSSDVTSPPSQPSASAVSAAAATTGRILYRLKEGGSQGQRAAGEALLSRYGIVTERSLVRGQVALATVRNNNGRSERQIAVELEATGAVEFAEADELLEPAVVMPSLLPPNDPLLSNQWHHTTINSQAAWGESTGSSTVKVAICDTGVEQHHLDLITNVPTPGISVVDALGGGPNPLDPRPHGTLVAGVVAAIGNNDEGVAGVNWVSAVLPVRISNNATGSASISSMILCIDHARENGAKLVNISYSGVAFSSSANAAGLELMNAGGLLVVAAANDNTYYRKSTNHPGIIVVAATDQNDAKATFSNWGSFIDISAPGVAIHTTRLTTNINGMYGAASGTSFSSPMVAAVAALIWSKNASLSPVSVRNILFRTARDLGTAGYDETFGYGRVDAGAALAMAAVATEPVAPPTAPSAGRGGGKNK